MPEGPEEDKAGVVVELRKSKFGLCRRKTVLGVLTDTKHGHGHVILKRERRKS
jgi:hypothetical protein